MLLSPPRARSARRKACSNSFMYGRCQVAKQERLHPRATKGEQATRLVGAAGVLTCGPVTRTHLCAQYSGWELCGSGGSPPWITARRNHSDVPAPSTFSRSLRQARAKRTWATKRLGQVASGSTVSLHGAWRRMRGTCSDRGIRRNSWRVTTKSGSSARVQWTSDPLEGGEPVPVVGTEMTGPASASSFWLVGGGVVPSTAAFELEHPVGIVGTLRVGIYMPHRRVPFIARFPCIPPCCSRVRARSRSLARMRSLRYAPHSHLPVWLPSLTLPLFLLRSPFLSLLPCLAALLPLSRPYHACTPLIPPASLPSSLSCSNSRGKVNHPLSEHPLSREVENGRKGGREGEGEACRHGVCMSMSRQ